MNGGTARAPSTASELCSVKPQTAPTIAASTVMTTITGSRCRQSAMVLSVQTQPMVISEISAAVSWDHSTGPSSAIRTKARAAALSRTCWRSRTLMAGEPLREHCRLVIIS